MITHNLKLEKKKTENIITQRLFLLGKKISLLSEIIDHAKQFRIFILKIFEERLSRSYIRFLNFSANKNFQYLLIDKLLRKYQK